MTEIIIGREHSEREDIFFERVKEAVPEGGVIVIVPDQFSYEMDKLLYDRLGGRAFNQIETAGITALADRICKEYGGRVTEHADDNSRLIAMYRAQIKLRSDSRLVYYKKSLLRPSFVSECITLISQLLHSGATPETLMVAAEHTPSGGARLRDISLVFTEYVAQLEEMGLSDTLSQTQRAARLAAENGYFKDRAVFLDSFTDFSADELGLVRCAAATGRQLTVSLMMDGETPVHAPFGETERTYTRIKEMSEQLGKELKTTEAYGSDQSAPLEHINRDYFSYGSGKTDSQGLVRVCSAADIYEESDWICAEIIRLMREEDYLLNEIAVLCGSVEETAAIIGGAAEKYDIPYFADMPQSGLDSVPARYLMSLLDACMTKEYRTENILRIVKSPLSDFFYFDACDLEEFCVRWNVDRDMWNRPFRVGGNRAQSERIELTRQRIIGPLDRFRNACKGATAGQICEALYTLLDEMKMSDKLYSQIKSIPTGNDTETELRRSFKQVWLATIGAIKSIYKFMPDTPMSIRAFSELLKLMFAGMKLSAPPQKAACLRIGAAGHSRMSGVRALFIMQANDGVFPAGIKSGALFGERELNALKDVGAELETSAKVQIYREQIIMYTAVSLARDRLYISYSESDRTGGVSFPSQLPGKIRELFEDDIFTNISQLPTEFFCTSYKTAFYNYLVHSRDKTQEAANIYSSLQSSAEYSQRLDNINAAAMSRDDKLSENMAKKLFFPSELNISATRVSDYYKCPFSYFCKHGLKLYEPKAVQIDPQYVGNIAHSCLEHVMSREEDGRRVYDTGFTELSDDELYERVSSCTDDYVRDEMGGEYGKTPSFRYAVERLKRSVQYMAMNFREEMKNSLFLPAAFEYDLTDEDGEPILSIMADGTKINLRGMIDRADLYRTEQCTWLRIVDYKTGRQTFDCAEVYNGLDLQMLIYLLAATIGIGKMNGVEKLEPAGIMYSHIRFVDPMLTPDTVKELEESGELYQRLMLERSKKYKPDGLLVGEQIFPGLNKSNGGVYTIFRFTSGEKLYSSETPISTDKLKAMEMFALDKVLGMAQRLKSGDIAADPLGTKRGLPCVYCEYKAICKNADPAEFREVRDDDRDKLDEELEKIIENGLKNMPV